MNRKIALAVGAGVIAAGGVLASAATLGGVTAGSLGTDSAVVAGCTSSGVTIKWNATPPAYAGAVAPANSTYNTANAVVNVPTSCVGKKLSLAVADNSGSSSGPSVATGSVVSLQDGDNTVTLSAPVNSKTVLQTTVTIYD
jgi:hypothetical protein